MRMVLVDALVEATWRRHRMGEGPSDCGEEMLLFAQHLRRNMQWLYVRQAPVEASIAVYGERRKAHDPE